MAADSRLIASGAAVAPLYESDSARDNASLAAARRFILVFSTVSRASTSNCNAHLSEQKLSAVRAFALHSLRLQEILDAMIWPPSFLMRFNMAFLLTSGAASVYQRGGNGTIMPHLGCRDIVSLSPDAFERCRSETSSMGQRSMVQTQLPSGCSLTHSTKLMAQFAACNQPQAFAVGRQSSKQIQILKTIESDASTPGLSLRDMGSCCHAGFVSTTQGLSLSKFLSFARQTPAEESSATWGVQRKTF